ncbi:hypothetical protein BX616_006734, partial [Lobosporangium transversale]
NSDLKPAPREQFAHLKANHRPGDNTIISSSINQTPKDFDLYSSGSLLVTEQMIELWNEIQGEQ